MLRKPRRKAGRKKAARRKTSARQRAESPLELEQIVDRAVAKLLDGMIERLRRAEDELARQAERRGHLEGKLDAILLERDRQTQQLQNEVDRLISLFRGPSAYTGMQAAAGKLAPDDDDELTPEQLAELEGLRQRFGEIHGDGLDYDELLRRRNAYLAEQEQERADDGAAAE